MIINAFKDKIFPMIPTGFDPDEDEISRMSPDEDDSSRSSSPKGAVTGSARSSSPKGAVAASSINNEVIDPEIIRQCFMFDSLDKMYEFLNKDSADKDLNAAIIDQALLDLELDINKSSKAGRKNKQLKPLANIVEKIFNDATNNQQGQGLKTMTPKQIILRLPILLAQLKAGNNSQKLTNEIRQIVYLLYRSKQLSKIIYNSLMSNI